LLLPAELQSPPRFLDSSVAEAFADVEGRAQALAGDLPFAKAQVGEAAEVETIGSSPGVSATRLFGAVERVTGVLEGLSWELI